MKRRTIKFAASHEYLSTPVPSSSRIPNWYKKLPKFSDGSSRPVIQDTQNNSSVKFSNKTVKHCTPFLDALTSGYVAELWQDVQVVRTIDGPEFSWPVDPEVASFRSEETVKDFPVPAGCYKTQFVWRSPYIFKTPPGYSVLVTHPLNRVDLPFTTLSGIIDSDSVSPAGDLPFYLKEDFEGIIEAGTPIFQIIPFKREDWTSKVDPSLVSEAERSTWLSFRKSSGFYRDNYWRKKRYE